MKFVSRYGILTYKRTKGDRQFSLAGRIGKRVQLPCGTAAVMAELWLKMSLWVHMGRRTKAMTLEPEDLPSVPYCRKGRKHGADGPNASMLDQGGKMLPGFF